MKQITFDGEVFACYRLDEIEEAKAAQKDGQKVLIARPCANPDCKDLLFGDSLDPNLVVECEGGMHNQRPGVWV